MRTLSLECRNLLLLADHESQEFSHLTSQPWNYGMCHSNHMKHQASYVSARIYTQILTLSTEVSAQLPSYP